MKPELLSILKHDLSALAFVNWDRYYEDGDDLEVYGWIPRNDAHEDFVSLRYIYEGLDAFIGVEEGEPTWRLEFSTSSAKHTKEILHLLGCTGEHHDCQRVESILDLPNVIRLGEKAEVLE